MSELQELSVVLKRDKEWDGDRPELCRGERSRVKTITTYGIRRPRMDRIGRGSWEPRRTTHPTQNTPITVPIESCVESLLFEV